MRYWCVKLETPGCGLTGYEYFQAKTEEEAEEKATILCDINADEWWDEESYECEDYSYDDWICESNYELEEITKEEYEQKRL